MNDPENAATPSILAKIDRIKGTEQAREGGSDKQEASVPLTAPRPPPHGLWAPASKDQGGWPCSTQAPRPRPPCPPPSSLSVLTEPPAPLTRRPHCGVRTCSPTPCGRWGRGGARCTPPPPERGSLSSPSRLPTGSTARGHSEPAGLAFLLDLVWPR